MITLYKKLKSFLLVLILLVFAFPALAIEELQPRENFNFAPLKTLPILHQGRTKSWDTFAREVSRRVTGSETFEGFAATELLLSWLTRTDLWEQQPLLKVHYHPLAKHLSLPLEQGRLAPQTLRQHAEFQLFYESLQSAQAAGQSLNEMEREGARLADALRQFQQVASGELLTIFPSSTKQWLSLSNLAERYPSLSLKDAPPLNEAKVALAVQALLKAYYVGQGDFFAQLSQSLKELLARQGKTLATYPAPSSMQREVHFNELKPFQWAWVLYALAAFLAALALASQKKFLYGSVWFFCVGAFALHTYGFVLRMLISGRAPVTNMYETVIWIPYGTVLFAFILEAIYRKTYFLLAASMMSTLGLIVAESAPHVLDPALDPLVPVLRSNYWLTVHVLTITLSYAAFTLALGVANVNLAFYLFRPQGQEKIKALNLFIYRAIQIGVVLLAAGTILGGVWANDSWGRFWGWDPKEVWALIALLGYLALLHGRYAGWVKGFGMTAGAVLAYLLVLMAWYGVNFVLGVGLHSYGFSSGGASFVIIFSGLELIYLSLAAVRKRWA